MAGACAGKHYPRSLGEFQAWFAADADAKLVIAIERHALLAAPKDHVDQEIAEPVTV